MAKRGLSWGAAILVLVVTAPGVSETPKKFDEVSARIETSLKKLASVIDSKTKRETVGFIGVTSNVESSSEESATKSNSLLFQALLARSLIAVPLDSDKELVFRDADGHFSKKLLLGQKNLVYLRAERDLKFLLISEVGEKRDNVFLSIELIDLVKIRRLSDFDVPLFKKSEVDVVHQMQILPPMNVRLLTYALENLGEQVGTGECWDLPAKALKSEGFSVNGYDFGLKVPWADALPGDVVSIDNDRDHHVMVLVEPTKLMKDARILHQNANKKRFVTQGKIPSRYFAKDLVIWRPGVRK